MEGRKLKMKKKLINRYFDSYEQYKAFRPYILVIGTLLTVNIIIGILF